MKIRRTVKLRVQLAKSGTTVMYVVTLPREFVEALGWQRGDKLAIELDTENKQLVIRKEA